MEWAEDGHVNSSFYTENKVRFLTWTCRKQQWGDCALTNMLTDEVDKYKYNIMKLLISTAKTKTTHVTNNQTKGIPRPSYVHIHGILKVLLNKLE